MQPLNQTNLYGLDLQFKELKFLYDGGMLPNKILLSGFLKKKTNISILFIFPILLTLQNNLEADERYNNLFLAYVKTESNLLNHLAFSGLTELSSYLIERTSLNPVGVKEVDLLEEEIFFYPLIYWQITNLSTNFNEIPEKASRPWDLRASWSARLCSLQGLVALK